MYCVTSSLQHPRRETCQPGVTGEEAKTCHVQPPLPTVSGPKEGEDSAGAKSLALKHLAGLGRMGRLTETAPPPPAGTQAQRHAQHTLDCANVRKIGTSSSSSRWSAHWIATFRMWIGSSLRLWESKTGWVVEGPGAPPRPLLSLLPTRTLTVLSSSEYRDAWALLKRGMSLGMLAKQEMTSSKFLGAWEREGRLRGHCTRGHRSDPPLSHHHAVSSANSVQPAQFRGAANWVFPKSEE